MITASFSQVGENEKGISLRLMLRTIYILEDILVMKSCII